MEEEKTKGRVWNGYACPGCRTVFRVAADFAGADVACPSCKETLRLPKTPEEVPPTASQPEKPRTKPKPLSAFAPARPVQPADQPHQPKPTALRAMLSSSDGRLKLALTLLLPLAVIAGGLLLFPPGESTPEKRGQEDAASIQPETTPQAPPPPPVAVSEMPDTPPPPSLAAPQETPATDLAVVQPVPEPTAPLAEPKTGEIEVVPPMPEPGSEPVTAVADPEHGLVEAIPVESAPLPEPEKPAPLPAAPAVAGDATAPAELIHTVVRGDTLSGISSRYQVDASIVRKANGMKVDKIMLGQKLKIPGGIAPAAKPEAPKVVEAPAPPPQAARSHTVVRGDTLGRIARKYGVTPQQVMQANGMKNDVVRLGRKLVIPAP